MTIDIPKDFHEQYLKLKEQVKDPRYRVPPPKISESQLLCKGHCREDPHYVKMKDAFYMFYCESCNIIKYLEDDYGYTNNSCGCCKQHQIKILDKWLEKLKNGTTTEEYILENMFKN